MAPLFTTLFEGKFGAVLIAFEVLILFLFGFVTTYRAIGPAATGLPDESLSTYYSFYMDVHVMIFVGFGFLVTFMHSYSMAAVALNFLLAACAVQWSLLTNGFWLQIADGQPWHAVKLDIENLIDADFAAAAALITYGVLMGKCSPLFVIMFIEMIFYSLNMWLGYKQFNAVDAGGSVIIHTFGAYFGLACSLAISRNTTKKWQDKKFQGATTVSDTMAMVGTLFLWIFWPSFNCAFAEGAARNRIVINTLLSLTGAVVLTFIMSFILRKDHKFNMVDVQNATLAGGVAMGGAADLIMAPFGAILVGCIAGFVSVLGFVYLLPYLERKIKLHDTAGVHNLHGMPGLIGGFSGVIASYAAADADFGAELYTVFSARDPANQGRSATEQACYQLAMIAVTLGIAVTSGYATGCLVRHDVFEGPNVMFHDPVYFHVDLPFTAHGNEQHHHELQAIHGDSSANVSPHFSQLVY